MSDQKLYHDQLIEHYKYPTHRGTLEGANFTAQVFNPLCGDEVTMYGIIKNETLTDCKFEGKGCVISLASASMLADLVIGKSVKTILQLDKDIMLKLVKLKLGPTRLRCALLALEALQKGVNDVASSPTSAGA